jgi:hypothetical protein
VNYKKEPFIEYDDGTNKRVVENTPIGFIYWHWMYNVVYFDSTTRAISNRYGIWNTHGGKSGGLGYYYFSAFESSVDCPYLDNLYCCSQNLPSYDCAGIIPDTSVLGVGTNRYFRFQTFESKYTDYRKCYQYRRVVDGLESDVEVFENGNTYNVKKLVRYIRK